MGTVPPLFLGGYRKITLKRNCIKKKKENSLANTNFVFEYSRDTPKSISNFITYLSVNFLLVHNNFIFH